MGEITERLVSKGRKQKKQFNKLVSDINQNFLLYIDKELKASHKERIVT